MKLGDKVTFEELSLGDIFMIAEQPFAGHWVKINAQTRFGLISYYHSQNNGGQVIYIGNTEELALALHEQLPKELGGKDN